MEKTMKVFQTRFRVGHRVTWASDHWANFDGGRERFGDGPFRVVAVSSVPHSDLKSVGHPQSVEIDVEPHSFSGLFFKHAKRM